MTQHSRDTPQFYLTAPSPCPYLPGRHERKVFTHLVGDKAGDLNDLLTHGGFRRSQSIAYRPACDQCRACVSVRVIANEFRPSRGFRKILARNADIIGEQRADDNHIGDHRVDVGEALHPNLVPEVVRHHCRCGDEHGKSDGHGRKPDAGDRGKSLAASSPLTIGLCLRRRIPETSDQHTAEHGQYSDMHPPLPAMTSPTLRAGSLAIPG